MEPIELEEDYDGPHLSFPLTIDQVGSGQPGIAVLIYVRGVCAGLAHQSIVNRIT
jgi:hypothetical protein